MADTALTYVLSFTVCAFALLLIALISFYIKLTKKYVDLSSKTGEDSSKAVDMRNKIINEANIKAIKILDSANSKASQMIGDANVFNKVQSDVLEKQLQIALANYQKLFGQALEQVKNSAEISIQNISKDVTSGTDLSLSKFDQNVNSQIESLKINLENKLLEFQNVMQTLAASERERIQKDFEEIKELKITKLDEKILDAVYLVSREFLEKGLSPRDHEELITKALKQAKDEGVLK
ncbi:hypothetical protein IPM62_01755 [Candidatus Woesebacteria bacterium]|nr:MAG: hypothetical protein IPM62_01755 [Candidatus Woesebacteria bacterium]